MKTKIQTLSALLSALLITELLVLGSCQNPLDPPRDEKLADGRGSFSLQIGGLNLGRTILPVTAQNDFAAYTLAFSTWTVTGQETVTKDRTNANLTEPVSLRAGTWNLAVTAYMDEAKNMPAAQGTLEEIEIKSGAATKKSLELKAIIKAGSEGEFTWNIEYPSEVSEASIRIEPLDTKTGTAEQSLYFIGGTSLVDKNNGSAPLTLKTGYYRVTFSLKNGELEAGCVEYLHIYQNMKSEFSRTFTTQNFTSRDFILFEDGTAAPQFRASTLQDALDWFKIPGHTKANVAYIITLAADAKLAPFTLDSTNMVKSGVTITLKGEGTEREISLSENGSLFTIKSGYTLVLDSNITLKGREKNNASLVQVNQDGTLMMKDGKILDNDANTSPRDAKDDISVGGVYVSSSGTFTMEGGEISGNSSLGSNFANNCISVGGVYVSSSGTFTMKGGEISGNNGVGIRSSDVGNYYRIDIFGGVSSSGTFTMEGGKISGNTSNTSSGGGVSVSSNGTFTMKGGEISDGVSVSGTFTMKDGKISINKSDLYNGAVRVTSSGIFIMEDGEISGNTSTSSGGGVYVYSSGTFTMKGGKISGNTSNFHGGGVYVSSSGTFIMEGGEISDNYSGSGGGGVYVYSSGTFTMKGGKISGNTVNNKWGDASYGGGVFAIGTFTMEGGEILGNTANWDGIHGGYGGGVHITSNGTFTMKGGEISGNTGTGIIRGGGVSVSDGGTFTMKDGEISGNTSSRQGGGVYFSGSGTLTMEGGEISGNTSNNSGGGGVYVSDDGTFTMKGGKISGNTGIGSDYDSDGGGVCISSSGTFTMEGGEISGNTSSGEGGGVYFSGNGTFTMKSGEISGNTSSRQGGGVSVSTSKEGAFLKIGGVIYGYSVGEPKSNAVKNTIGEVQNKYYGHAVYLNSYEKRETTVTPAQNLDSTKFGAAGGWTE
ncbi:hypothetical protein AGMMS49928_22870 [Spirochaetia bacterium]|nr:hypothetical protein AGMMS49928_22870 [Spirochaetia bacterium]